MLELVRIPLTSYVVFWNVAFLRLWNTKDRIHLYILDIRFRKCRDRANQRTCVPGVFIVHRNNYNAYRRKQEAARQGERKWAMLTLIFVIATLIIFAKLLVVAVKAAWSIAKIICCIFLLPVFIVCLFAVGLVVVAVPLLAIVGIFTLVGGSFA